MSEEYGKEWWAGLGPKGKDEAVKQHIVEGKSNEEIRAIFKLDSLNRIAAVRRRINLQTPGYVAHKRVGKPPRPKATSDTRAPVVRKSVPSSPSARRWNKKPKTTASKATIPNDKESKPKRSTAPLSFRDRNPALPTPQDPEDADIIRAFARLYHD
jgi:hypothetical protein